MGVPEGWQKLPLRDLGGGERPAIKAGPFGSALKKSFYVDHGYRVYGQEQVLAGSMEVGDYYIDADRFEKLKSCEVLPGDLLISLVGTIGRALVVPEGIEPGIINPRLLRISTDLDRVEPEFLCAWLSSPAVRSDLADRSHGGTMPVLNGKTLGGLEVLLPPLPEQRKIAAILSSVDEAIEKTQAVIDQVQVVKKGLMQELLTRGLPGRHSKFKQTEIGEIPEEWQVVELGKVGRLQTGLAKNKKNQGSIEVPYLRVANVQDGHVDLSEVNPLVA